MSLGSSGKKVEDSDKYWEDVKLLLRMKYDNSGTMVGFYNGGKKCRGLSLRNMTKLYRDALVIGGGS